MAGTGAWVVAWVAWVVVVVAGRLEMMVAAVGGVVVAWAVVVAWGKVVGTQGGGEGKPWGAVVVDGEVGGAGAYRVPAVGVAAVAAGVVGEV